MPTLEIPSVRLSIPFNEIPTFVRSTCLTGIRQSGCGAIIAYRLKYSSQWMMGVVICYRYNQPTLSNYIELYEFVNVVDKDGIPSILRCDNWESMKKTAALSNVLFRRTGIALSQPGVTSFHHCVYFHEIIITHLKKIIHLIIDQRTCPPRRFHLPHYKEQCRWWCTVITSVRRYVGHFQTALPLWLDNKFPLVLSSYFGCFRC